MSYQACLLIKFMGGRARVLRPSLLSSVRGLVPFVTALMGRRRHMAVGLASS